MKVLRKIDRKISGTDATKQVDQKPNPSEYTTLDNPMEVPCQKEAYFMALNDYVRSGDKVLDVGCGLGYGLNLLSIKADQVYGVDIDPKSIDYCNGQVLGRNPKAREIKLFDGYKLPYRDNFFDVLTTIDVLEHVEHYDRFIDELMRVTKRSIVISTPNRRAEYTNPDGTPRNYWHLREWSHDELDEIIVKHNKVIEWHHFNGPWEGPFTDSALPTNDTLTLTPVIVLKP